jgi:hypothetical protein
MRIKLNLIKKTRLLAAVIALALVLTCGWARPTDAATPNALNVQAQAAQGFAAPGNSAPANFLIVVTDENGAAVTNLTQEDFTIVNHFSIPGQTCGFSNNIVTFNNVGNGAYHIQVDLVHRACTWVKGDYLAQVMVADGARRGQAAVKFSVN